VSGHGRSGLGLHGRGVRLHVLVAVTTCLEDGLVLLANLPHLFRHETRFLHVIMVHGDVVVLRDKTDIVVVAFQVLNDLVTEMAIETVHVVTEAAGDLNGPVMSLAIHGLVEIRHVEMDLEANLVPMSLQLLVLSTVIGDNIDVHMSLGQMVIHDNVPPNLLVIDLLHLLDRCQKFAL